MIEPPLQVHRVAGGGDDGLDGIGLLAVPVGIEDAAQSLHHAADDQYIHIDEIARRTSSEILVRDVAPAHDRSDAVRDEQLVVHSAIETLEGDERRHELGGDALPAAAERIEHAHFHVPERSEAAKHLIAAGRVKVIDEQAHAHAAQRRVAEVPHEQAPGAIVCNEVVLDVERVHRAARKLDPCVE